MACLPLIALGCGGGGGGGPTNGTPQFGTVSGQVREDDNTPVAGAGVALTRAGLATRNATTGTDGAYQFTQVETGAWTVTVVPPDGFTVQGSATANVNVVANQTAAANFVLARQEEPPPVGQTHNVTMQGIAFNPPEITISVNDAVVWTNTDVDLHNVLGTGFNSPGNMPQNATFEHQFTAAGTFDYVCSLHPPDMTGTIIVQ